MSRLLGIDYGRKKLGLALAESAASLASPLSVLLVSSTEDAISKIANVVKDEQIEEIVVGVSESVMAEESKAFGGRLNKELLLPVHFSDETLTTAEAQALSLEAGMSRKKAREMEDAFAATLILQNHLDSLA